MMRLKIITLFTALLFNLNAHSSVINTLDGVEYEWLELSETADMSYYEVLSQIDSANPGDLLYGYNYASRQLTQALLLSYMPYDGVDGLHGSPDVVTGTEQFFNDFGALRAYRSPAIDNITTTTVDGYTVTYEQYNYLMSYFLYGTEEECGDLTVTCLGFVNADYNSEGNIVTSYQGADNGFDTTGFPDIGFDNQSYSYMGSLLVHEVAAVPVPAAIWLFGSGLIGLAGIIQRKKA